MTDLFYDDHRCQELVRRYFPLQKVVSCEFTVHVNLQDPVYVTAKAKCFVNEDELDIIEKVIHGKPKVES